MEFGGPQLQAVWRIHLLGELRAVRVAPEPGEAEIVSRFRTHKTAALLAFLAYHRGAAHTRDALCDSLWAEDRPEAARASLRTALASLRRQLEPPGVAPGSVIQADRSAVQLSSEAATTDVGTFRQALHAASRATSPRERMLHLQEAVDAYRGDLLPSLYADWVLQERAQLRDAFLSSLVGLANLAESRDDPAGAVAYLRRSVAAEPTREALHRRLIQILLRIGEPQEALRQFRELELILRQELETTPSRSTRDLVAPLLVTSRPGSPTPRVVSPPKRRYAPVPDERPSISGTATFLLADLEFGSKGENAEQLPPPAGAPDPWTTFREKCRMHGGRELRHGNDHFAAVFPRASDALACAMDCVRRFGQPAGSPEVPPGVEPDNPAADQAPVEAPLLRFALHTDDRPDEEQVFADASVPTLGRKDGPLDFAFRILMAARGGQILCSEETAALLRRRLAAGTRLSPLGLYRLRDAVQPERLFQVEHPDLPRREFPPLLAPSGYIGSLPAQLTRFVGRDRELTLLSEALLSEEVRSVVLTGPPGVGKTRLALEAASRLTAVFFGEVWYVSLAEVSRPEEVPHAIARAMHRRAPGVDPLDQIADGFSSQAGLLLLDHAGHLGKAVSQVLAHLLTRAPLLTGLITSYQRLPLFGAREMVVDPLPVPNGAKDPNALLACPSVELFVSRAQAVQPDFQLTRANASAVAVLCTRLQGLPLAVERAASRINTLTPRQMVAELDRALDFLAPSAKRQPGVADLRASLAQLYEELRPELRQLLIAVSVLEDGWAPEVPRYMSGEASILQRLMELRDQSLLQASQHESGLRFSVLDVVRQYVQEQAEPNQLATVRRRHASFLLRLEELYGAEFLSLGTSTPSELAWEIRSLQAALEWSRRAGDKVLCARLALLLGRFYRHAGRVQEAERCMVAGLQAVTEEDPPAQPKG